MDGKRRFPSRQNAFLCFDCFGFTANDILQILTDKGIVLVNDVTTEKWADCFRGTVANAAVLMAPQGPLNYTQEGLGKFLAQDQEHMNALYYCLSLGPDHVKGLIDARVDDNHDAHPLKRGVEGINIHGNAVHQAAWNTIHPKFPFPQTPSTRLWLLVHFEAATAQHLSVVRAH